MSAHPRLLSARVKTSATVLATGVGAAIATGALATPAVAGNTDPWARVRQCESGGNYSTNTGNGYYGAYQFSLQTWRSLGMHGLPSQASPDVQDRAARRLAAQYGLTPWPICGHRYGGPPPTAGRGVPHVHPHVTPHAHPHVAATPSSVWLPSRATWPTGTHRPSADQPTAARAHADPSPQPHRSYQHYYRAAPGYHSDDLGHWDHGWQATATETSGAGRVLSIRLVGQTRADVRLYQLALDRVGYHLVVDGRFGRDTRLATRHFQAAHRLVVDGLAGPRTKAALVRTLAALH